MPLSVFFCFLFSLPGHTYPSPQLSRLLQYYCLFSQKVSRFLTTTKWSPYAIRKTYSPWLAAARLRYNWCYSVDIYKTKAYCTIKSFKCRTVPLNFLKMVVKLFLWLLAAFLTVVSCDESRQKRQVNRGPLYDYVYRADPNFFWTVIDSVVQEGFTTYTINITTQKWYNETFTNHPIWWHYLVIHVPNTIRHADAAFMYISHGSNNDGPPSITKSDVRRMGEFANATGIVSAVFRIVPNQPIIFENDGVQRYEDDIITWTWRRFYNESLVGKDDPEVLLYMPMCKASVRAIDAIQVFIYETVGNSVAKFMVAGESKRGWTTWLMGGIDDRIVAIAPVVLSCLNMVQNFHHYYRSLGGWSFAMQDYWRHGLMGLIDEPEMVRLSEIVDPYSYRHWLTMPKLMISGASDEFFMADDYDYFYNDLLGEKYIWIIENSGHDVNRGPLAEDFWLMLQTFYISVLTDYHRPHMEWVKNATATGGQIILLSPTPPLNITSFYAQSVVPNRRDWRKAAMGSNGKIVPTNVVWIEKAVEDLGDSYYRVQHDNPAEGYLSFFIKVGYPGPDGRVLYFTTEANIVPFTWPHADCSGSECQGTLV